MNALELAVLVGLAAFRCSRLLARDAIFDVPRHRFFRRFPPDPYYAKFERLIPRRHGPATWQIGSVERRLSYLGQFVACEWCSSVWFSGAIVGALVLWWSCPLPALVWGGAATVAGLSGRLANG